MTKSRSVRGSVKIRQLGVDWSLTTSDAYCLLGTDLALRKLDITDRRHERYSPIKNLSGIKIFIFARLSAKRNKRIYSSRSH